MVSKVSIHLFSLILRRTELSFYHHHRQIFCYRLVPGSFVDDVCMMVIHTAMKCLPSFPHVLMPTPLTVNEINHIRSSAGGCQFQLVLFTCSMAGVISCGHQNGTSLPSCIATSMVPWRTMFCWFKFSPYKIFWPPKSNDG